MTDIVIGAGLAGLNAARVLRGRGREVRVLEADSRIGGRVATDVVDGFRCDRGFQLLNPSYPAARRALDFTRLDLHRFGRGAAVLTEDGHQVLADPTRHPQHAPALFRGLLELGDLGALVTWLRRAGEDDATFAASLDAAGFGPGLRALLERFFTGVTLDPHHETSASQVRRLAGYFAVGTPGVPGQGMAAVPQQLAEGLHDVIRIDSPVTAVQREEGAWTVIVDGEGHRAEHVVLACDPVTTARLLHREPPTMLGVTTWWFATDRAPSQLPFLHLDLRSDARLANAAVVSAAAPSYAPAGQHLVQASAVAGHDLDDEQAATQAAELLGADATGWRLLVRHDVDRALPAQRPGRADVPTEPGLHVAGDWAGASIQDALATGEKAAKRLAATS